MNPFYVPPAENLPGTNSRPRIARPSTASSWVYKQSTSDLSSPSSSSSNSDIFAISQSSPSSSDSTATLSAVQVPHLLGYTRHNNLDVWPLSIKERLRLARVHYVTFPNAIRLCTILFCLCWFIFVSVQTLRDYIGHSTIVKLTYLDPDTTKPPAISVCSHSVLNS